MLRPMQKCAVSVALWALAWLALPVYAAPGLSVPVNGEINRLESRFFFRLYSRDPLEKRLERIELLVFGSTQDGTTEQRLNRLKQTIGTRDAKSSDWAKGKNSQINEHTGGAPTHYPALDSLEWRALKKTYPNETLDSRLGRLEAKLFGQASSAMAYVDRIERLRRTLGMDIAAGEGHLQERKPLGPMPKAKPRSQNDDSWSGETNQPFGMFPQLMPGLTAPFGNLPGFSDMFRQLERQMEQLQNMPNGVWQWDPDSNSWINPSTGKQFKPNVPHQKQLPPAQPNPFNGTPAVPPYDDPNSI